jgi:hypothetical protein
MITLVAMVLSACDAESIVNDRDRDRIEGSGRVVTENRPASGFSAISFFTEGSVTITQGDAESLTVETDDNLMQYLETTVTDGVLNIKVQENPRVDIDPSDGIKWEIAVVDLEAISLFGAGSVEVGGLTADELSITVAGAMDLVIDDLSTGDLDVAVTGVAEIVLGGDVRTANLTLTGAGMIDTSALSAQHASALVSGAGDILVWAIDTLEATVTGIGDIKYHGSPSVARVITGAGSIRSTGDD